MISTGSFKLIGTCLRKIP